jgi:hypothetical protein
VLCAVAALADEVQSILGMPLGSAIAVDVPDFAVGRDHIENSALPPSAAGTQKSGAISPTASGGTRLTGEKTGADEETGGGPSFARPAHFS